MTRVTRKKSKHSANAETEEAKAILGDTAGMKHALDTEVEHVTTAPVG